MYCIGIISHHQQPEIHLLSLNNMSEFVFGKCRQWSGPIKRSLSDFDDRHHFHGTELVVKNDRVLLRMYLAFSAHPWYISFHLSAGNCTYFALSPAPNVARKALQNIVSAGLKHRDSNIGSTVVILEHNFLGSSCNVYRKGMQICARSLTFGKL